MVTARCTRAERGTNARLLEARSVTHDATTDVNATDRGRATPSDDVVVVIHVDTVLIHPSFTARTHIAYVLWDTAGTGASEQKKAYHDGQIVDTWREPQGKASHQDSAARGSKVEWPQVPSRSCEESS